MKTANVSGKIKRCSFPLPDGYSTKTEWVLKQGNTHYGGFCLETLEKAKEYQKKIFELHNIETKITKVLRNIYRDALWDKHEYIELGTVGERK
jgi:hypothetical protein